MDVSEVAGIIRDDYKNLSDIEKKRFDLVSNHLMMLLKSELGDVLLGAAICFVDDAFVASDKIADYCGEDLNVEIA